MQIWLSLRKLSLWRHPADVPLAHLLTKRRNKKTKSLELRQC